MTRRFMDWRRALLNIPAGFIGVFENLCVIASLGWWSPGLVLRYLLWSTRFQSKRINNQD